MTKAEEILEKHLRSNGCYNVQIVQEEVYKGVIDAINEALTIPVVVQAKRTFTAEQVLAILEDTEHLDDAKMMFVRSEL